jgi:hypothetical protein
MASLVYCPKCGDRMNTDGNTLRCLRGDMLLSKKLYDGLLDVFIRSARASSENPLGFKVGGKWFCPKTGAPLVEENGYIKCKECGNSLNEFISPLVELHPHKPAQ